MTSNSFVRPVYQRLLLIGGMGFLLLPNLLFMAGWLQPVVAVPLMLLILWVAYLIVRSVQSRHVPCTGYDRRALFFTMLGVLLVVEMISFHGHIPQMSDFFARNPIYNTLVQCDWPLWSARNEYFVYYAAYWLPPALVAKLMPSVNPAHFLSLWTFLGLMLSFGLFFLRLRARVLTFFLIFFLLGSLVDVFRLLPGIAWRASFDERWFWIKYVTDTFHSGILFPNGWSQVGQTFNHSVPMMVAASLIWSRLIPVRHMPFVASLSVISSPIGAIGLLFLLLASMLPWLWLRKGNMFLLCRCFSLWCGVLLLFFVGWYYSMATSSEVSCSLSLLSERSGNSLLRMCFVYIGSIGAFWLPFYLILSRGKASRYGRTMLFYAAIFLSVVISLIWVGKFNNELMFKASLFVFLFISFLLAGWWQHVGKLRKAVFVCFLVVYSSCFLKRVGQFVTDWSCSPSEVEQHIRDPWKGHLNHPEDRDCDVFWGERPQEASPWYTEEGASGKTLLAPVATGRKCSEMGEKASVD